MRGILDRMQSPEGPLPTFVAHMLSEFRKLKTPLPEQEHINLICKLLKSIEWLSMELLFPLVWIFC